MIITLLCILLITNTGRYFLLLFFGFFYPVYKSYQALETPDINDDKRWLTYWIVFGFFMAIVDYLQVFLDYLPLPKVLISAVFLFIYCPLTNGYEYIYNFVIKKLLKTYEQYVDKYV